MNCTPRVEAQKVLQGVIVELPRAVRRSLAADFDQLADAIEADLTMKALHDPSIGSIAEAAQSGGCRALATYRVARLIAVNHGRALARRLCDGAVATTGVDAHYSATIAPGVALDHSPVIIGETSIVASGVYLAGATLGVLRWPAEPGLRRHHIIGEDTFIGPRALILGPVTIGARCRIGAGAIVTADLGEGVVVGAHAVVRAPVGSEARIGFAALVRADVPPGARIGDRDTWEMQPT